MLTGLLLIDIHEGVWIGMNIDALLSSKSNEWFTPSKYVEAAREVMGDIELDPASCKYANQTVKAERYYTIEDNGLVQPWHCRSMWLNPPYGRINHISNQDIWTQRLIAEYETGNIQHAVLLVNAAVDTSWFQRLWQYIICFPNGRINFYTPLGSNSGSTHGSVLVYLGSHEQTFINVFSQFGTIAKRVNPSYQDVKQLSLVEAA